MSDPLKPIGTLHDPLTMFLQLAVGSATDSSGTVYSLSVSAGNNAPIITNTVTRRSWSVSWSELIALARVAGIDQPLES